MADVNFRTFIYSLLLLLLSSCGVSQNSNDATDLDLGIGGSDWMSCIDGNMSITNISIPGTHDSGTYAFESIRWTLPIAYLWATCQTYTLYEQLSVGIRYLDLRIGIYDNKAYICHGKYAGKPLCTDLTLKNAVNQIRVFLMEHRYEAVICHFRSEYPDQEMQVAAAVERELYDDINKDYVWDEARLPQLKEVRGKLIYWKFYSSSSRGAYVHWDTLSDGKTGESSLDLIPYKYDGKIYFSDEYKLSPSKKINLVKSRLMEMRIRIDEQEDLGWPSKNIFITYASTQYAGDWPHTDAKQVNPKLKTFLDGYPYMTVFGVIAADFVDLDLAQAIYYSNFRDPVSIPISENVKILEPHPPVNKRYTDLVLRTNEMIVTHEDKPKYGLIMQEDNNLVMYKFTKWRDDVESGRKGIPVSGIPVWATCTSNKGNLGTGYAILQSELDGNFVVYASDDSGKQIALWATGTNSKGDALVLQNIKISVGTIFEDKTWILLYGNGAPLVDDPIKGISQGGWLWWGEPRL